MKDSSGIKPFHLVHIFHSLCASMSVCRPAAREVAPVDGCIAAGTVCSAVAHRVQNTSDDDALRQQFVTYFD
jgi:hypothetical protein